MPSPCVPTTSGHLVLLARVELQAPPSAPHGPPEMGAEPQDAPPRQHSTLGTRKRVCKLRLLSGFLFLCCLIAKSCLTLCSLVDYNLPDSSALGVPQSGIQTWAAVSSSRASC